MSVDTQPPTVQADLPAPGDSTPAWRAPEPVSAPVKLGVRGWARRINNALAMKPAGWALLAIVLATAIIGWQFTWIELKLATVFGATLLVIALLFTIGKPSFQVVLGVDDPRVTVGQPAAGTIIVRNAGQRRNLPARLDLPIGDQVASFPIGSLAPDATQPERFTIPTERRGVLLVGPAHSVQGDPFGLTGRETNWTDAIEVFVHPRSVPLPGRQVGFVHDLEGHASTQLSPSDMSFHALREYAPGDDRRHVHWRSSARTGTLMVRQYEQTLQSRVCVALDLGATSYIGDLDFEDAVSAAASVVLQSIREQNPLALLTNDEVLVSVNAGRSLDELSRVERRPRVGLIDLVNHVRHAQASASVVVLITGAGVSVEDLRRACAVFDLDTRVIGIQADPDASMSVRNVSNVSLIRVAYLAQLPQAMRKAMS